MKLIEFERTTNQCVTLWFWRTRSGDRHYHSRSLSVSYLRKVWKRNKIAPMYKITNNGAKKENKDTCFDMSVYLGYFIFGYTNWNFAG